MTASLFNGWLTKFHSYFRSQNRHELLIVDSCSAHGSKDTLSSQPNTEVLFLRHNGKLQPCNAGIIDEVKFRYRTFQLERAIDLTEKMWFSDIYKVDVFLAVQAFQRIWNTLPTNVITKCCRHVVLFGGGDTLGPAAEVESSQVVDRRELQHLNYRSGSQDYTDKCRGPPKSFRRKQRHL